MTLIFCNKCYSFISQANIGVKDDYTTFTCESCALIIAKEQKKRKKAYQALRVLNPKDRKHPLDYEITSFCIFGDHKHCTMPKECLCECHHT